MEYVPFGECIVYAFSTATFRWKKPPPVKRKNVKWMQNVSMGDVIMPQYCSCVCVCVCLSACNVNSRICERSLFMRDCSASCARVMSRQGGEREIDAHIAHIILSPNNYVYVLWWNESVLTAFGCRRRDWVRARAYTPCKRLPAPAIRRALAIAPDVVRKWRRTQVPCANRILHITSTHNYWAGNNGAQCA